MPKTTQKTKPAKGAYQRILYPIDISDMELHAFDAAIVNDMVNHFESKLFVLTVMPDYGASIVSQYFSKVAEAKLRAEATKALQGFIKKHFDKPDQVEIIVEQGGIYEKIIAASKKVKADVIAMAAHRPQLKDYLLGPNSAKVVRHSKISVLVLREK